MSLYMTFLFFEGAPKSPKLVNFWTSTLSQYFLYIRSAFKKKKTSYRVTLSLFPWTPSLLSLIVTSFKSDKVVFPGPPPSLKKEWQILWLRWSFQGCIVYIRDDDKNKCAQLWNMSQVWGGGGIFCEGGEGVCQNVPNPELKMFYYTPKRLN